MKRTLTIVGVGMVRVAPDVARLQLGVRLNAPTAFAVSQQAAQAMGAIIDALRAQGIAESDIQTGHFAIAPEYFHGGEGPPQRTSHAASNMAQVTIRALDTVGVVIDAVLAAGGEHVQIDSLNFLLSEPAPTQVQARALALADARTQAGQIAHEMDVTLGKPLRIRSGNQPGRPRFQQARMAAAASSAGQMHPIEAGEMEITDQVEVVFAIR